MSDKSNEQISNLMDGELEVNASQFLLKRMASDKILSKTWDSYHLIKSCLQKDRNEPLVIDVAAKVLAQLSEPNRELINQKQGSASNHSMIHKQWLKPVIGIGIAASVAFVSVFMLQNQKVNGLEPHLQNSIVHNSTVKPMKTNINANVATSQKTFISPPASLTRFPSVSAKNMSGYNQGFSQNMNVPYLLIINQSNNATQLSPMRTKDVSD